MTEPANFCSDNVTGAAPEILEALVAANAGPQTSYGEDEAGLRLEGLFSELFETEVAVLTVATGTAANALALSVASPPYGAIYCHREAHINVDECGAPEFFTGGGKLVALSGAHAKLDPETLEAAITGAGVVHHPQPAAISISQASETGSLYQPDELAALSAVARRHGLPLHMDGARFANALVALDLSPAEMSWKAGVDLLSFGATKNGALAAEAVILFGDLRARAEELAYRRKRGGHLVSKGRLLSVQLEAYLRDELWLRNARHANAMAKRLSEGLAALSGVELLHPVEANMIFARLPAALIAGLRGEGFRFYDWGAEGDNEIRLVTAFCTREAEVESFLAAARRLADASAAA